MTQRLAVAPMMDWTTRHCRYFHRLLSPHAWLYTEMVTTGALLHGRHERHLRFDPQEHPVVLQLGGSSPAELAASARMGEDYGYDQINLNCGCPSDRVQQGKFGACLMAEPELVADCIAAMTSAVRIPVTVKCRIGIDDSEEFEFLETFVRTVKAAGCGTFIVHARKAWLNGLSPKENREKPPLKYEVVARLKNSYPDLTILLNGGLQTIDQIDKALQTFDGVMLGREAYQNPFVLAELETHLYSTALPDRDAIVQEMEKYISRMLAEGVPVHSVTRHMLGLYNGLRGARQWRRQLGPQALAGGDAATLLTETLRKPNSGSTAPVAA